MTTFVLASGPSLTPEDIETVRLTGSKVIAVNSTIFSAPFADICFGIDVKWWRHYHERVKTLGCRMVSSNGGCKGFGVEIIPIQGGENSGHKAIRLADVEGEKEIVLLGFDCKNAHMHHHGDHPPPMKKARTAENWIPAFNGLARNMSEAGVRIINCTRDTALDCFERMTLETYLGDG